MPADAQYVTIDMDVCYDTEDDPGFNVLAYDGLFLRVTDLTLGRLLRSVLPAVLAMELLLLVQAVLQGWSKQKLRSWWWLARHTRLLRARRRRVQADVTC